jgi:anti-sigma factor RsiW
VIARRTDGCTVHRAALIDFVDGGERTAATDEALRHLDRCERCEAELTGIALAISALRRFARDLATVEAPQDAWPTLRSRLARPRRPAIMSPILGMAMAMAIVVGALGPAGLVVGGMAGLSVPATDGWPLEEQFINSGRHGPLAQLPIIRLDGGPMRSYPDGVQPQQKEVTTARLSGRQVMPS